MKTPYITVECSECGQHVMVPGKKAWAGKKQDGGLIVFVNATCPQCGTEENHYLSSN